MTITVLPSATSLRALRKTSPAHVPLTTAFIGIGDPILEGSGRKRGGLMLASRGFGGAVEEIRKLDRLPGTEGELKRIAEVLGADPKASLYTGARASKPVVLALNAEGRLGEAQVLAFATHALLAGQITGLRQPALVLTPPATPTDDDDGLLSMEDILGLKLTRTEWVILSACNTAAGDGSGEGLSGLAQAFFFAGARALLVSHWNVDDRATEALMTKVLSYYSARNTRAEALKQGMVDLLNSADGPTAYFAHPYAWAPFFLVGEGQ